MNPFARTILVVGFGVGITAAQTASHPVDTIHCVELCPGVKDAAHFFAQYNNMVIHDPRVTFITGDGRNHLLLTDTRYDIISCDPTHPILGSGNLYTKEYFQLCRRRLNKGGVVTKYLPLHNLSLHEFKSIIKTFQSVFPHSTLWLGHSHGVLLGTEEKLNIDFQFVEAFVSKLENSVLDDPYYLAIAMLLDENALREFSRDGKIHTDNKPFLDFFSPRSLNKINWHITMTELMKYRSDPLKTFSNISNKDKLLRYNISQQFFVKGLIAKNKDDRENTYHFFREASIINPENRVIQLFYHNELKSPG